MIGWFIQWRVFPTEQPGAIEHEIDAQEDEQDRENKIAER
jgi:hypothetical protein